MLKSFQMINYLHGLLEPRKCGIQSARLVKTIVGLKVMRRLNPPATAPLVNLQPIFYEPQGMPHG